MSKCENCVHYERCDGSSETVSENYQCDYFKDKSLFVELPCKVGDKVYVTDIKPNEVIECEITSFTVDCDGVGGFSYEPLDIARAGISGCDCLISEWGDVVFLDRAEAERKLKEVGE